MTEKKVYTILFYSFHAIVSTIWNTSKKKKQNNQYNSNIYVSIRSHVVCLVLTDALKSSRLTYFMQRPSSSSPNHSSDILVAPTMANKHANRFLCYLVFFRERENDNTQKKLCVKIKRLLIIALLELSHFFILSNSYHIFWSTQYVLSFTFGMNEWLFLLFFWIFPIYMIKSISKLEVTVYEL